MAYASSRGKITAGLEVDVVHTCRLRNSSQDNPGTRLAVSPTEPGKGTVFHPQGGHVKAGLFYVPTGPIPKWSTRF